MKTENSIKPGKPPKPLLPPKPPRVTKQHKSKVDVENEEIDDKEQPAEKSSEEAVKKPFIPPKRPPPPTIGHVSNGEYQKPTDYVKPVLIAQPESSRLSPTLQVEESSENGRVVEAPSAEESPLKPTVVTTSPRSTLKSNTSSKRATPRYVKQCPVADGEASGESSEYESCCMPRPKIQLIVKNILAEAQHPKSAPRSFGSPAQAIYENRAKPKGPAQRSSKPPPRPKPPNLKDKAKIRKVRTTDDDGTEDSGDYKDIDFKKKGVQIPSPYEELNITGGPSLDNINNTDSVENHQYEEIGTQVPVSANSDQNERKYEKITVLDPDRFAPSDNISELESICDNKPSLRNELCQRDGTPEISSADAGSGNTTDTPSLKDSIQSEYINPSISINSLPIAQLASSQPPSLSQTGDDKLSSYQPVYTNQPAKVAPKKPDRPSLPARPVKQSENPNNVSISNDKLAVDKSPQVLKKVAEEAGTSQTTGSYSLEESSSTSVENYSRSSNASPGLLQNLTNFWEKPYSSLSKNGSSFDEGKVATDEENSSIAGSYSLQQNMSSSQQYTYASYRKLGSNGDEKTSESSQGVSEAKFVNARDYDSVASRSKLRTATYDSYRKLFEKSPFNRSPKSSMRKTESDVVKSGFTVYQKPETENCSDKAVETNEAGDLNSEKVADELDSKPKRSGSYNFTESRDASHAENVTFRGFKKLEDPDTIKIIIKKQPPIRPPPPQPKRPPRRKQRSQTAVINRTEIHLAREKFERSRRSQSLTEADLAKRLWMAEKPVKPPIDLKTLYTKVRKDPAKSALIDVNDDRLRLDFTKVNTEQDDVSSPEGHVQGRPLPAPPPPPRSKKRSAESTPSTAVVTSVTKPQFSLERAEIEAEKLMVDNDKRDLLSHEEVDQPMNETWCGNQPVQPDPVGSTSDSWHSALDSSSDSEAEEEPDCKVLKDKMYMIAEEIIRSEQKYLDVIRLLNVDFRQYVLDCKDSDNNPVVTQSAINQILNYLPQIQTLSENLLLDLANRMKNWDADARIADVILKISPFFKLYKTYMADFELMNNRFDELCRKNSYFANAVRDFEKSDKCKMLAIKHHMLKPVQRIPQYKLLLERYIKHVPSNTNEYDDAKEALYTITSTAERINQSIKDGDNLNKMVQIQSSIVGNYEIIRPGRKFVKEGMLNKLSRKGNQERWFVLFNDCLLYMTPLVQGYKINYNLPLTGLKVMIPTQEDYQNEFSIVSIVRSFSLSASSQEEREGWIMAINSSIEKNISRRNTYNLISDYKGSKRDTEAPSITLGHQAPVWIPDARVTMCQICTEKFTVTFRRHHCRACGKVVCWKCSSNKAALKYLKYRPARVCDECYKDLDSRVGTLGGIKLDQTHLANPDTESDATETETSTLSSNTEEISEQTYKDKRKTLFIGKKGKIRSALQEVSANDPSSNMSGYLSRKMKRSWKKYWFVIKDKVLYMYSASEDVKALESAPLLGYQVSIANETVDSLGGGLMFQLEHRGQPSMFFHTDNLQIGQKWMKIMEEATVL